VVQFEVFTITQLILTISWTEKLKLIYTLLHIVTTANIKGLNTWITWTKTTGVTLQLTQAPKLVMLQYKLKKMKVRGNT